MPLNVGTRLGHYDVTALIGEAGMGQGLSGDRYEAQESGGAEDPPRRLCTRHLPRPDTEGTPWRRVTET